MTLPTPTRNGYTFDGWYTSADCGSMVASNVTVRLTYDQTLYAHWSENKQTYTLYFDPDGGNVDVSSKEVTYGEYYGELPTPYREGYKFEGWRTGRNGTGSLRVSGKYVTTKSDETVYAHWSLIDTRIRVHFDTNGGPDHGYLYCYESNDTYGNLPSTEWAGYIFEGWYTKPTGGTKIYSTTKLIQDSEHTLYAHWTKEETPPEPSTLAISGLRVTVSDGKIRASASVSSNYDLTDFTYSNGAAGGGLGSVGKNKKTFEYTYEVDYRNLAYERQGVDTLPTIHEGVAVRQMEAKGIATDKGDFNRWVRKARDLLHSIKKKIADLADWIIAVKDELSKPQAPTLAALLTL